MTSLFGKRKESAKTQVKLAVQNQPEKLVHFMGEAGIRHGQTVEGNLKNVRIDAHKLLVPELYFCPMTGFQKVNEINSSGDSNPLPEKASLPEGLYSNTPLCSGFYNIEGLLFYSNGSIQITQTAATKFELVERI